MIEVARTVGMLQFDKGWLKLHNDPDTAVPDHNRESIIQNEDELL